MTDRENEAETKIENLRELSSCADKIHTKEQKMKESRPEREREREREPGREQEGGKEKEIILKQSVIEIETKKDLVRIVFFCRYLVIESLDMKMKVMRRKRWMPTFNQFGSESFNRVYDPDQSVWPDLLFDKFRSG